MSEIDLHIVCFDVPYPENYGGVIDVYNRLRSLHKAGVKIALHCFEYGRGKQSILEESCEELHYYRRSKSLWNLFSSLPFIVVSRKSNLLIENLLKNEAPILFEGHHSTFYLKDSRLKGRLKWVRTHNIEQHYYRALARASRNPLKRIYYRSEAKKISRYETQLKDATTLFPISPEDCSHFEKIHTETHLLPAFHGYQISAEKLNPENIALYHANLAVEENYEAALFLIQLFSELNYKLVIAGRKPNSLLINVAAKYNNIELVADPEEKQLEGLIRSAKVNCLYTEQATGVKLKLIRALIQGNEIIGNAKLFEGTTFGDFCYLAESKADWKRQLQAVFAVDLDEEKIRERQQKAAAYFDNEKNIDLLTKRIRS